MPEVNFGELWFDELPRIYIPGTWVNKGTQKAGALIPRPSYILPTSMLHLVVADAWLLYALLWAPLVALIL
jgi:hypothetical protein